MWVDLSKDLGLPGMDMALSPAFVSERTAPLCKEIQGNAQLGPIFRTEAPPFEKKVQFSSRLGPGCAEEKGGVGDDGHQLILDTVICNRRIHSGRPIRTPGAQQRAFGRHP
jgi:hypothetical protein